MPLAGSSIVPDGLTWENCRSLSPRSYVCAYCGSKIATNQGYCTQEDHFGRRASIYVCPACHGPTVVTVTDERFPIAPPGEEVPGVPADLAALYHEARCSAGESAYTASVLVCRKLLMNIAVQESAEEGKSFAYYVEYLADKGFLPPRGKAWVDHVRKRGNEANHEIHLMSSEDASLLIAFVEMLLRFIYEFPQMIPGEEGAS